MRRLRIQPIDRSNLNYMIIQYSTKSDSTVRNHHFPKGWNHEDECYKTWYEMEKKEGGKNIYVHALFIVNDRVFFTINEQRAAYGLEPIKDIEIKTSNQ